MVEKAGCVIFPARARRRYNRPLEAGFTKATVDLGVIVTLSHAPSDLGLFHPHTGANRLPGCGKLRIASSRDVTMVRSTIDDGAGADFGNGEWVQVQVLIVWWIFACFNSIQRKGRSM